MRGRGRLRLRRVLLAVMLLAVGGVMLPSEAAIARCPSAVRVLPDRWERIGGPSFAAGGPSIADYALDAATSDRVYATNGVAISGTADGGCTWHAAQLPADDPVTPLLPTGDGGQVIHASITALRTPGARVGSRPTSHVWAVGQTTYAVSGGPVAQPRVLVSDDFGRTFTDVSQSLPMLLGTPVDLRAFSLFGHDVAYLLVHVTAPQDDYVLYVTTDDGSSWSTAATGLPQLQGLALNPTSPNDVWAWDASRLYHSSGNKVEFAAVPAVRGTVRTVDVTAYGEVSVFMTSGTLRYISSDGGRRWHQTDTPAGVNSAMHGPVPGFMVISATAENVLIEPGAATRSASFDASPYEDNVSNVQVAQTLVQPFVIYASNPTALWRLRTMPKPPPPPPPPPPVVPPGHKLPDVARLTPDTQSITLRPHEHRRIPYRLRLPPAPTPLDVYFMTDSTGSMETAIHSVQESVQKIVDDLAATGTDVNFGVADFRDYPNGPQSAADSDNYAYKRRRAIGPVNAELSSALNGITTGGGTTDGDDSGLEAMFQAATGAGRLDPLDVTGSRYLIEPGLGADFRPAALKIVLVAADDEFRHPDATNPGYPGPSVDTVATTLAARGVHVVGIKVNTNSGDPSADMRELARRTSTLATGSGVDCDGDGTPDLAPGDPLVCPFTPGADESIAPAFIGLLNSVRDIAPVSLAVRSPAGVAHAVGPTSFAAVNVKVENNLPVPVDFACESPHFGTTTSVTVVATVRGRTVAQLPISVRCLAPDGPAPAAPPAVLAALPALAVPPAQPQPPNPNPNPNPNPQVNTNPGVATADEQEQQLAFAQGDITDEDNNNLAMAMLTGAAALTFAAACGVRVSRKHQWRGNR